MQGISFKMLNAYLVLLGLLFCLSLPQINHTRFRCIFLCMIHAAKTVYPLTFQCVQIFPLFPNRIFVKVYIVIKVFPPPIFIRWD